MAQSSEVPAPPIGRLYEAGGRRVMLHGAGGAGPAVVFLAGGGLIGADYANIHARTAGLALSVIYDRAGTGWSETAELPRTGADVVTELHELLAAAGVPGPYLLVGHSLGGAYARLYAQRFPDEVAGMLLLDPFHEDMPALAPEEVRRKLALMKSAELPSPTAEQIESSRGALAAHFAAWPESVRQPLIEYHLTSWRIGWVEDKNLYDVVSDELRGGPQLPDIPLIVLSAMGTDATQAHLWGEETVRQINEGKLALHARLAAAVPRGEHRVLEDAGHGWIFEERQDAVLQAITDLIASVSRAD